MYSRDYRRSKEKCRLVKLPVQDSAPKIQVIHFPWFSRLFFPLCWFSFINKYHLWNSLEPTHSRKKKCLFLFLNICAQGKNWTVLLLVFFKKGATLKKKKYPKFYFPASFKNTGSGHPRSEPPSDGGRAPGLPQPSLLPEASSWGASPGGSAGQAPAVIWVFKDEAQYFIQVSVPRGRNCVIPLPGWRNWGSAGKNQELGLDPVPVSGRP